MFYGHIAVDHQFNLTICIVLILSLIVFVTKFQVRFRYNIGNHLMTAEKSYEYLSLKLILYRFLRA